MKGIISAVLATLLVAGTAFGHEETDEVTFTEALTQFTVSQTLVSAAMDEAQLSGMEGFAMQAFKDELGNALDIWQGLVVESCAADWYSAVEVSWMLQIAVFRELGTNNAEPLIGAIGGVGSLVQYYQTNAAVACGLGD